MVLEVERLFCADAQNNTPGVVSKEEKRAFLLYSSPTASEPNGSRPTPTSGNPKMKGARLVFSSREARLLIERARKNAKMAPFNSDFGAGSRTRTYEGRSREIYSLLSLPLDDSSTFSLLELLVFLYHPRFLMEPRTGFEPVTSSLPWMRSTN